jgi:hypothetical protein
MDPNHFPSRLHEMLSSPFLEESIVAWQPHGKCFLIKRKEKFVEKVMPR